MTQPLIHEQQGDKQFARRSDITKVGFFCLVYCIVTLRLALACIAGVLEQLLCELFFLRQVSDRSGNVAPGKVGAMRSRGVVPRK